MGAYSQAVCQHRELDQHHLTPEPLAGLARVALMQGNPAQARVHADEILAHLEERPALEGTWEPLRIYLTCYRVLQANGDTRARKILETAHSLLQERESRIEDEDLRRSYLENIVAHQDIIAEWTKTSISHE